MPDILATLHPSPPRRFFGLATLVMLGGFLLWIAMARPPEALGWRVFLLAAGGGALWLSWRMHRATSTRLELTREALRDAGGSVIARVEDIQAVDRGTFAIKPSSGFRVTLKAPGAFAWEPGLWWRLRRSIGVGGVTSGNEAKYMAEVLSMMLEERSANEKGA